MENMLIANAVVPMAVLSVPEESVWGWLLAVVLAAVGAYALYRWTVTRERKRQEALRAELEQANRKQVEAMKQQVLARVSQELLTPVTLIISPLQQMASEPLSAEMGGRVQMILRNAQLLLHQVNMLPIGTAPGSYMPTIVPTVEVTEEREPEPQQEDERRFTMLMVDDSADMCRFVRDYFRGDYHVITARNGEQALKCLEEHDGVDLVVSDILMPKMDGLELCRRVKTDLRWSHIPVILLTGRTDQQMEREGRELGADEYITKPFNVEMLRMRVKKLIEKRENRQRQFREKIDVLPSDITITSVDEQFIQRAIQICEEHIADSDFSVEMLGHELSLSRTYLYKKIINITGKAPGEFIRTIRLKRGKQLIDTTSMTVADVAAAVGYGSAKRFAENFKGEFGASPSEYAKKLRMERTQK